MTEDPFDYLADSEQFRKLLLHACTGGENVTYICGHVYAERTRLAGVFPVVSVWGSPNLDMAPRVIDARTAKELCQGPIGDGRGSDGTKPVQGRHADYRVRMPEWEDND